MSDWDPYSGDCRGNPLANRKGDASMPWNISLFADRSTRGYIRIKGEGPYQGPSCSADGGQDQNYSL